MGEGVIGSYQPGNSIIHKLDPRVKLLLSLALMILVFFLKSPWALGLYAVLVLTIVILSQVNIITILKGLRPIIVIVLIAFALNIFTVPGREVWSWGFLKITAEGLSSGLLVSTRLILLTIQTTVLISYTTSSLLLADSIESLLSPLKRFNVPVEDFALMISIALRFVPTIAEEANKIIKAQSARGANIDTGSFWDKIKGIMTILVPLFINSIKRADELAIALEARAYGSPDVRTKFKPLKYETRDFFFAIFSALMIVAVIVIEVL